MSEYRTAIVARRTLALGTRIAQDVGMERKRAGVVELRLLLAELREHEPEKYAVILRLLARLLRSAKLSVDVKRGV